MPLPYNFHKHQNQIIDNLASNVANEIDLEILKTMTNNLHIKPINITTEIDQHSSNCWMIIARIELRRSTVDSTSYYEVVTEFIENNDNFISKNNAIHIALTRLNKLSCVASHNVLLTPYNGTIKTWSIIKQEWDHENVRSCNIFCIPSDTLYLI